LKKFAPRQAERARQGWRIVSVEQRIDHELTVDGAPFRIRGTIDRIDIHDSSNQIAIWDYKTSDRGDSPDRVHRDGKGWKDLQLPLYRHLAADIEELQPLDLNRVELGYILLPRDLSKVRYETARWTSEQLAEADQLADEIVRKIRAGEFWPPARIAPIYSEDFSAICQDAVFEHDTTAFGAER
jgi:hypothetical protein